MGLSTLLTSNRLKPKDLRPATSYDSFSSQLALLPLRVPPPPPPVSLDVPNNLLCPNPNCDIGGLHTWLPPHPIPPCPPHMPVLDIKRFEHIPNPRPTKNRYGLFVQPPFQIADGQWVYTSLYGVVNLQVTDFVSSEWMEYQLVEEWEGVSKHVATLLVWKEWCNKGKRSSKAKSSKLKLGPPSLRLWCC